MSVQQELRMLDGECYTHGTTSRADGSLKMFITKEQKRGDRLNYGYDALCQYSASEEDIEGRFIAAVRHVDQTNDPGSRCDAFNPNLYSYSNPLPTARYVNINGDPVVSGTGPTCTDVIEFGLWTGVDTKKSDGSTGSNVLLLTGYGPGFPCTLEDKLFYQGDIGTTGGLVTVLGVQGSGWEVKSTSLACGANARILCIEVHRTGRIREVDGLFSHNVYNRTVSASRSNFLTVQSRKNDEK